MGSDREGLVFIDGKTGDVSNYKAGNEQPISGVYSTLTGNYNVTSICFDSEGRLWVGIYGGGVNLFDTEKKAFVHRYLYDPEHPHSLNDNNVLDIYQDKQGNIWVGTRNGGLNRFFPEISEFEAYREKDGLPSNNICSMVEDDEGKLWLSTNNRLARFDIHSKTVRYYDKTDGLLSNLFMAKARYKDSTGQIYFGNNKGVNFFDPEEIRENPDEPDLMLTDLKLYNKSVEIREKGSSLQRHISLTDSIVLKHDQTALTIEYVGLNYISSQKNRYAFKMEGLEDEWRYVGNQRAAYYSNLPPGHYCFKVKASNNDDVWTLNPLSLYIEVLPPLWRSNTAYIIYILLFFSLNFLVLWFVKWVNKRQHDMKLAQLEQQKEKQMSQFRLQFFTNISHELRTHLTLIIHPINKLLSRKTFSEGEKNELERIDLNAKRLLKLTDEIIDFRRVEQGKTKLEIQQADVVFFIRQIEKLFKSIADEHGIRFGFSYDQPEIIWGFDQEKLTKIIFNLLSNAFKYTPDGGSITIYARVLETEGGNSSVLRIGVKDNGIGIDEEILPHVFDRFFNPGKDQKLHGLHDSSGIGLALVKQLVELHGGVIHVESSKGTGSYFYFDLTRIESAEPEVKKLAEMPLFNEYEEWEEMLRLERSNFHDEFAVANKFQSGELPSVLIVDDNREICRALAEMLEGSYRIFTASNGEKALKVLEKEIITVVLSDIMMPGMDGITLCKKMKKDIRTSHIPVIMLTAKVGLDNELIGLRTGADAYISKPFNSEKVQLTIKNILLNQEKVREYISGKDISESEVILHPLDKKLMEKIETIIHQKMGDADFSVDKLGNEAGLSRMHLYRKIKALTDLSPREFVKKIRLEKSKEMLEKGEYTVSEIAYDVGFSTPGNFSTAFKNFYGTSPAQFRAGCFK
jgi:signal transduction histidine kinase/AraC-like DNA-binding protein